MEREPNELTPVFRQLRGMPGGSAAARARLERALAGTPPPVRTRRVLGLPPLSWAAGLIGLFLLGALVERRVVQPSAVAPPATVSGETATRPVQFVLVASDAQSVSLVGDFNDWDPSASPLERGEGGVWSVVLPLRTGQFTYSFLVDGREWRADPAALRAAGEDFGRPSSVLLVARAET